MFEIRLFQTHLPISLKIPKSYLCHDHRNLSLLLVLRDEGKDNNKLAYSPPDDPEAI